MARARRCGCGVSIGDERDTQWPDVLKFVVASRNGKKGGDAVATREVETTAASVPDCGDEACSLKKMRAAMKLKAEQEAK